MNDLTAQEQEAESLRKRFETLKKDKNMSRMAFAKKFGVPGLSPMIYQHINCIRPINMDAALAYMKGFACSLEEISPRLADEARKAASASRQKTNTAGESHPAYSLLSYEDENLLKSYKDASAETQAAVDLLLLPRNKRSLVHEDARVSIKHLELAARDALENLKNIPSVE